MPFAQDSGLVYKETILKKTKYRGPMDTCLSRKPACQALEKGAHSLTSIATLKILHNLHIIDAKSLSTVPSILLQQLWKAIQRCGLDSLRVWQTFAQTSIGQRAILYNRTATLTSIDDTLTYASQSSCAWITNLTITEPLDSAYELVQVSRLVNLRRFHMATIATTPDDKGLNDRILRSWAEEARIRGAFSNLQTIFLYRQNGVTKWSLAHLDSFPALDEFCAYGCRLRRYHLKKAKEMLQWSEKPNDGFVGYVKTSRASLQRASYGSNIPYYWDDLAHAYLMGRTAASTNALDSKPTLEVFTGKTKSSFIEIEDLDKVVCLLRKSGEGQQMIRLDSSVSVRGGSDQPPPVKRRRIVFDSPVLGEMMGE